MFKIIYYRNKCIGCGICYEQQPGLWRMSKKDGKATLLKSTAKKDVFVLSVSNTIQQRTQEVARDCPVKIIKVL
jgi:ferredoxin